VVLTSQEKIKAKKVLDRFEKIQSIRQRSLEILVRINKKVSAYKLARLTEKLEELSK
jgi:hypothetical protein